MFVVVCLFVVFAFLSSPFFSVIRKFTVYLLIFQDAELLGKLEKRVSGAASPAPLLKLLEGVRPLEDEMMLLEEDLQHSSSSSDSGSDTDIELN